MVLWLPNVVHLTRSVTQNTQFTHKDKVVLLGWHTLWNILEHYLHHLAMKTWLDIGYIHCAKKPVTTMLTYPWKWRVLHCNHLGNTWKPLVLMTRHFDYCPSASEGDNQSVRSSAPVVSRCFPGGYNVKLSISRGRLAWWLLAFLHSGSFTRYMPQNRDYFWL